VDAASMFFVTQPERFDVIVTDNLFGDILTDLGAAVAGGIGLAASGNINPARRYPSMFEPVHGSAPDIAGQSKADPTAAILSAGLLCSHLDLPGAAAKIEQAVADDVIERGLPWRSAKTSPSEYPDSGRPTPATRRMSRRVTPPGGTDRIYPDTPRERIHL
jgi:3-isopropylmalate dehydrogenase